MWFRLPSGILVNLDKVSRIGISERSPEMRTGARYRVYAVDDSTDYTLYESDSCIDRDDEGNDVLFTMDDDDPPLGGTFRLS